MTTTTKTTKSGNIEIRGARVHNLKSVTVQIPRLQFTVVTGVSGSGKSSLVFDTLYAEGHRRYVESLSSYARQFLSRMQKPDVDAIVGISPAIGIEQRAQTGNPRSTVGSVTEVYDYLRLLFARIGKTYSPVTGHEVRCHSVTDVVEAVVQAPKGSRVFLLVVLNISTERSLADELALCLQKGFSRIWQNGRILMIEEVLSGDVSIGKDTPLYVLVDRLVVDAIDDDFLPRLGDSVQTAFNEGHGRCWLTIDNGPLVEYSELFEADGMVFEKPTPHFFNHNNPFGVCKTCEGFGNIQGYDPALIVPKPEMSVAEGAVALWETSQTIDYRKAFVRDALKQGFPVHRAYTDLSPEQQKQLWDGLKGVDGIWSTIKYLETQTYKVQVRVLLSRFRNYVPCPDCQGSRIRKEARYVKIDGHWIGDLLMMPLDQLLSTIRGLNLSDHDRAVSSRLLTEVVSRLDYLCSVGLGYLTLNRKANTLSGGESQRIHLATSLGSNLMGSLYILDEPSIGLHPRDSERLVGVLRALCKMGNTVVVVEHDETVIRSADHIIDVGPNAGELGGEICFAGPAEFLTSAPTLTADYLTGRRVIALPEVRRKPQQFITIKGAKANNLRNIDVDVPLGVLCLVTGVSGSGKTSLIKQILIPALQRHLEIGADEVGLHDGLAGALDTVQHVEMVDQNALSRNMRSNPVTYTGAYDLIRDLFANLPAAKERNLKPLHFSFNVEGGRCSACEGEGEQRVEMQFLPDVRLVCDVCGGKRFKPMVLEVKHKDKNIYNVLNLTVSDALDYFADQPKIIQRLQQLNDVGLEYLRLGQSTSTLSGGEAQRLKLASYLNRKEKLHTLYVFDEPSTGLHVHDINKLMAAIQRLVDLGNSVLIIEHNLDIIKCADWVLDLGPEAGVGGGQLVFAGPPEGLIQVEASHTGRYLKPHIDKTKSEE